MKRIFIIICMVIIFASSQRYPVYEMQDNKNIYTEKYLREQQVQQIIDSSDTYMGKPYRWGSTGPFSYDCSGFIQHLFKKNGIELPRTSYKQYTYTLNNKVELKNAKAGDLIFFRSRKNSAVGHVGMIISINNDTIKFIHASITGIKVSSLSEAYYKRKYVGVSRII